MNTLDFGMDYGEVHAMETATGAERYTWQDKRVWFDVIVKSWCLDRKAGREPQHLKIDIYHVVLCKRT